MYIRYVRIKTKFKSVEEQIAALQIANCSIIYIETDSISRFENTLIKSPQRAREQLSICLDRLNENDKLVVCDMRQLDMSIRGTVHLLNRLKQAGVYLSSLDDGLDTSLRSHQVANHLSEVFEKLDSSLASERSSRSIAIAKLKGRMTGRPLKADPSDLEVARGLICNGVSVRNAAKQTALSQATLYRRVGAKL